MTKYKWIIADLISDINIIEEKLKNEDNNSLLYDDLEKIEYMLSIPDNFDKPDEIPLLLKRTEKLLKNYDCTEEFDSNNVHQFKTLKLINEDSKEILKSLNKYHLKRKKNKYNNRGLFECVLWTEYTLLSLNKKYYEDFCRFKDSSIVTINNHTSDTWIIKLKSVEKEYYNVSYHNNLEDMLNLFHSFAFHQLNKVNDNRKDSIYDWTLEVFYYLVASDILKSKNYDDSYDIKSRVFNELKAGLNVFEFISYNNDSLEYDQKTANYRISLQSSIYDREIVQPFYNSIKYENFSLCIKNTYSYLLAIYLYNQHRVDKDRALKNIDTLINCIGVVEDNHIIEKLDIDIEDFVRCRYYDEFYKKCQKEYKLRK